MGAVADPDPARIPPLPVENTLQLTVALGVASSIMWTKEIQRLDPNRPSQSICPAPGTISVRRILPPLEEHMPTRRQQFRVTVSQPGSHKLVENIHLEQHNDGFFKKRETVAHLYSDQNQRS